MKLERIINKRVLIAVNSRGEFFGLREGRHTTSPFTTNDITKAKQIEPYDEKHLEDTGPATYYFENSDRMRGWLEGFKMVGYNISVRMVTEYAHIG